MKFFRQAVLSCALLLSVLGASHAMGQFFIFENPLVGETAPDFSLKTLDGQEVNFTKFRNGQNTMVFFWATWCPHCREELQELTGPQGEEITKKGIKILLVDIEEKAPEVSSYVKKHKINFDLVLDGEGTVAEKYNIVGVPTFFFVDKEGIIRDIKHEIPENYGEIFAVGAKP